MATFLLFLLLGYLVGSLSPGYFFGQLVKKIDIRKFGISNTGATNTYQVVGPVYGVITAIIDFAKAPFVYYLSLSWLNPSLAIFIGLAAVVGHIKPFYLTFRGGRGVASLLGLIIITLFYTQQLAALALAAGSIVYWFWLAKERLVIEAPWRKLLKLLALVLPLGLIWFPPSLMTALALILLFVALGFDLIRFLWPSLNQKYLASKFFAKAKEAKRLSGYTLFLASVVVLFNFFPKEIAVVSLVFFILGDSFAPFSSVPRFLPHQALMKDKTLSGALIIFGVSFLAGLFLNSLTPLVLPLRMIIVGSVLAAILDQFSFVVDDNLLVPLGTALGLVLL